MSFQSLKQSIIQNKKLVIGLFGLASLGLYLIGRRNIVERNNKLSLSLEQLLDWQISPSVKRIVITESSSSNGQIRKQMVELMKKTLNQKKVKVLVNCSPQQLLNAGCSSFINNVEKTDKKWVDYYVNALKTQILIEKTILDIDSVTRQQNRDQIIVMICDNNSMDIKVRADQFRWVEFVHKYKIDQQKLMKSYDLVIHIESAKNDEEEKKIRSVWANHPNYSVLKAYEESGENCMRKGLDIIEKFLESKQ